MVEIIRFGPEARMPFPYPGSKGLTIAPIQLPTWVGEQFSAEQKGEPPGGKPILLDRDVAVAALYLEANGEIHENDSKEYSEEKAPTDH